MALKKREKILVGATGGALVLFLAFFIFGGDSGSGPALSVGALRQQVAAKTKERDQLQRTIRAGKTATDRLAQWEQRSLPPKSDVARLEYQKWLNDVTHEMNFSRSIVTSKDMMPHRGIYTTYPFSLQATVTLDQLTKFLYKFYSAGYLHQIKRLNIQPQKNAKQLDVSIEIEAASLAGAKAQELPSLPEKKMANGSLEDYQKIIVRREMEGDRYVDGGVFLPYSLPQKPPAPKPVEVAKPKFDHLRHTIVTGILEVDRKPEVWLMVRTTGQQFQLHEGQSFEVGDIKGSIGRIHPHEVEIEFEGVRHLVPQGGSLRDGTVMKPQGGTTPAGTVMN